MTERKAQPPPDRETASSRRARAAAASNDANDPRRVDRLLGLTHDQAALRLLAPVRTNVDLLAEIAAQTLDPAEAYERLIALGLLPDRWLHAGRQVLEHQCRRCALSDSHFVGHSAECGGLLVPQTVRSIVTLASNLEGVMTAELLAREAWVRMHPWRWSDEPTVIWQVADPAVLEAPYYVGRWVLAPPARPLASSAAESIVEHAALRAPGSPEADLLDWAQTHSSWMDQFREEATAHWSWALSERKRPNPFTPLCELWMLGYCLVEMHEKTLHLFAPALS